MQGDLHEKPCKVICMKKSVDVDLIRAIYVPLNLPKFAKIVFRDTCWMVF